SATRDDADTVAIENAALIGVGGVDGHEDSRGSFVELRRFPCFLSRVAMVGLTTADRDRRELFIRRLERRLVLGRHEHGAPSCVAFLAVPVEGVLASGLARSP